MSRKGKSHEINDILDTAFTETDYSHGNGFYDEIRDHQRARNTNGSRVLSQMQTPASTSVDTKSEKNMFLKYSQNDTSVKNNDMPIDKHILVDDDNFPSLGGAKPKPSSAQQSNKSLNFKKIVTSLAIPIQDTNTNTNTKEQSMSRSTQYTKSNRYMMYNNIKDNSEKIARYKMENEYSSDNDDY